jgi:hypothetical protein
MSGLIFNIFAYILMAVGSYFAFEISIKQGNKITKIINYVLLFWFTFMVMYFLKDYKNIIAGPLNVRLNFFETVTNALLGLWLISFKFNKKL